MKLLYEKNKYKIYKVIILMMGKNSPSLGIKNPTKIFLGIDMFSETATRILSLSQRPFTTQFGKGCCVSTSTKTPRKRTTLLYKVAQLLPRKFQQVLLMVYKIKSLGLLAHVSFRMHYCTSTSCLSNGSSCRDLPCLSFVSKTKRLRQKSTHLKVNFLLICFQQLFTPDIATQRLPLVG